MKDTKEMLLRFIKKQKLAVISTVSSENKPDAAVIEFGVSDSLDIYFETFNTSRKYRNLQNNNNVCLVTGWDENITVQYHGMAQKVTADLSNVSQLAYWAKNEKAQKWEMREGVSYFKIVPYWIRYTDLNVEPWNVIEISL